MDLLQRTIQALPYIAILYKLARDHSAKSLFPSTRLACRQLQIMSKAMKESSWADHVGKLKPSYFLSIVCCCRVVFPDTNSVFASLHEIAVQVRSKFTIWVDPTRIFHCFVEVKTVFEEAAAMVQSVPKGATTVGDRSSAVLVMNLS